MHRRRAFDRIEHPVDCRRRPFPFVGAARQVGLVELDNLGVDVGDLPGEHVGDRHGELRGVGVVLVFQGLGQHVRAGEGEFERPRRQRVGARRRVGQIESAVADRAVDDARRLGAKAHAGLAAVGDNLLERDFRANARHGLHEIFDHAVGFGMIDVEAVEFAVAHHIDAGCLLGRNHRAGGVDQAPADLARRRANRGSDRSRRRWF